MSKLEMIRALYDYNEYANGRVLEAASKLSEEDLSRTQGASFDSVEGNLGHIVGAQVTWLARWMHGGNPRPITQAQAISGLGALRVAFDASHAELREFIAGLSDERLDRSLTYEDSAGNAYKRVLWQLMLHVANHGSYHRAETAMALTAMGYNPGDLDYVFFEIARDAANVR